MCYHSDCCRHTHASTSYRTIHNIKTKYVSDYAIRVTHVHFPFLSFSVSCVKEHNTSHPYRKSRYKHSLILAFLFPLLNCTLSLVLMGLFFVFLSASINFIPAVRTQIWCMCLTLYCSCSTNNRFCSLSVNMVLKSVKLNHPLPIQ